MERFLTRRLTRRLDLRVERFFERRLTRRLTRRLERFFERRLTRRLERFFERRLTRRLDLPMERRLTRRLDLRIERFFIPRLDLRALFRRGFARALLSLLLRPRPLVILFPFFGLDAFTLAILFQERIKKNYLNFRKKFPYLSVFDFFSERLSISLGKQS
jgi:hypothetical protein